VLQFAAINYLTGGNGIATHTATDANGCNYTISLNLTVNPVTPPQTDNISICSSQLPYTWNGQVINTGGNGVATHTTQDPNGCAITTTLNLTVSPTVTNTENISICSNELPYTWNGQVISTGGNGVATHTTQDANGCIIITTLNLTINPAGTSTEDITICSNELPYAWYGQTITAGGNGIATHSGQDANGCDVIITLNLIVNPITNQTENIQICQNALPYSWNGQTITTGGNGVATHVTQDANGCNVTTTLNLIVSPVITLTNNETICQSQLPFIWNGQTITIGGNGVATHTTQDANGCDVITTLNLTIIQSPNSDFSVQAEICAPADIVITPDFIETGNTYQWYVDGELASSTPTFSSIVTNPGCSAVRLVATNTNGCASETTVNSAFCVEETPIADFSFNQEFASSINPIVQTSNTSVGANSYLWNLPNGSSTEFQPTITFDGEEGTYSITLYAYTINGCVDSITKTIRYKEEIIFFIPNTFTPDNDEHNNSFGVVIASGIDIYNFSLILFNRWGEKIWESHDPSIHWNGTYNGKMVQDGMYTWKLDFKEKHGDKRHSYTGHVNIIR
jgi:gliding motility-associated-like protein